jgi:hypothetical protein
MSALAAATVAALLIANPSSTDADRVAANGGFLLGSAHRCGIAGDRIVQAGQLVRGLILAAAEDQHGRQEAVERFARFFLVSAVVDPTEANSAAPCQLVAREFARFERHRVVGEIAEPAIGGTAGTRFRLGDGE